MAMSSGQRWCAIILALLAIGLGGQEVWSEMHQGQTTMVHTASGDAAARSKPYHDISGRHEGPEQTPLNKRIIDLAEIEARPVFSPWREPPISVEEKRGDKPAVVAPVRAPPRLAKGQIRLIGIVIDEGNEVALVQSRSAQSAQRLGIGDEIDGWTLRKIELDSIALEQAGVEERVLLRDAEEQVESQRRQAPQIQRRPLGNPRVVRNPGSTGKRKTAPASTELLLQRLRKGEADSARRRNALREPK